MKTSNATVLLVVNLLTFNSIALFVTIYFVFIEFAASIIGSPESFLFTLLVFYGVGFFTNSRSRKSVLISVSLVLVSFFVSKDLIFESVIHFRIALFAIVVSFAIKDLILSSKTLIVLLRENKSIYNLRETKIPIFSNVFLSMLVFVAVYMRFEVFYYMNTEALRDAVFIAYLYFMNRCIHKALV